MYFSKILIANRGEIAVRIIRACHELGIAAVAIYSEADRAALHVRQADEAYLVGPAPAAQSYLNIERIVMLARESGAQAVHPGYGFLSERASFARACEQAGLVFIGPPASAIELMGSKIAAKQLAERADVPTAPGYLGNDQAPDRLRAEAERIGFPLLIKASAGGGGRGMRVVYSVPDFADALEGAQREALAAFGDDSVFLERLILHPRHVEVQVFADAHGHCVHLFERECSIQRRHQKIVEESPSPGLHADTRVAIGAAAVRLAQAADYRNAGTIEFVLDQQNNPFFLEMNTRLQVEHPVTELVTGLDLVRLQIAVAAGESLPFTQADLTQRGHAIEMRLYAEDPATWLPSTGSLKVFVPPEGPGIRNDVGYASGDEVSVHYDALLAKLIVSAPDRAAAIARLRQALDAYGVLGVTTNLPLLQRIAAHAAFAAGATTTDFLQEHVLNDDSFAPEQVPIQVLVAAALHAQGEQVDPVRGFVDPWELGSWRLDGNIVMRFEVGGSKYAVALMRANEHWQATIGEQTLRADIIAQEPQLLTIRLARAGVAGSIERFFVARDDRTQLIGWRGAQFRLYQAGLLSVDPVDGQMPADPGVTSLQAPMPGTVIKLLVQEGQAVHARQPLLVLEAMKMEHTVAAPYDGTVRRLLYQPGALVRKDVLLVELDPAG